MIRSAVFDVETTGLDSRVDRVLEIGLVEIVDRKLGAELQFYVNPNRPSHPDALAIHGITEAFLEGKPQFSEIIDQIQEFVADSDLIAHNAPFDVAFLDSEYMRAGCPVSFSDKREIIDTLAMARKTRGNRRNKLDDLIADYGVKSERTGYHGALVDARALARVWLAMTAGQERMVLDNRAPVIVPSGVAGAAHVVTQATSEELAAHRKMVLEHKLRPF